MVPLSFSALGAILLVLSITGLLSEAWNSALGLAAIPLLGSALAYLLISSRSRLHEWQALIASLISSVVTIFVAIGVTSAVTTAMKRTEFLLDFTKRYHEIRSAAHDLDKKVKIEPLDEGDAHQIYFRLFGLDV